MSDTLRCCLATCSAMKLLTAGLAAEAAAFVADLLAAFCVSGGHKLCRSNVTAKAYPRDIPNRRFTTRTTCSVSAHLIRWMQRRCVGPSRGATQQQGQQHVGQHVGGALWSGKSGTAAAHGLQRKLLL